MTIRTEKELQRVFERLQQTLTGYHFTPEMATELKIRVLQDIDLLTDWDVRPLSTS